jgi:hypothetical protein
MINGHNDTGGGTGASTFGAFGAWGAFTLGIGGGFGIFGMGGGAAAGILGIGGAANFPPPAAAAGASPAYPSSAGASFEREMI